MLNNVSIMGRLTADPELKTSANGLSVTTFTIANDRSYVKRGEDRQTDFYIIVAWRNTAEFICRNFRKGQLIVLNGSLQTHTYTDKEGITRKSVEITAQNAFFAGPKPEQKDISDEYTAEQFAPLDVTEDLPF